MEAQKLVDSEPEWDYVSRSIYRNWLDKQPKKEGKRIETRPLKEEINDQSYRLNPNQIEYKKQDDGTIKVLTDYPTKEEYKGLRKLAFIRELTTTSIEKHNHKRTSHDRSIRNNTNAPTQHQLVVHKDDIDMYLDIIKREFGNNKPKRIIIYPSVKYRTIITKPHTANQVKTMITGKPEDTKVISFTKEFCDFIDIDQKDTAICVKITYTQPTHRKLPSVKHIKTWKHPMKVKNPNIKKDSCKDTN